MKKLIDRFIDKLRTLTLLWHSDLALFMAYSSFWSPTAAFKAAHWKDNLMIISFLYLLLALLGLGFLIFIHELGHYFMAKKVGMRVETFAIGFGKPIFSWESGGTKWQIGWLLFGGYVKIAGTETGGDVDVYQISDGFFGKKPLNRILVSAMGPIVNLVFALLAFGMLWQLGGREQSFAEHTHKLGWVDPQSELYARGIRPGDEITAYNSHPYTSLGDHVQAPMTSEGSLHIQGNKVNYITQERVPYDLSLKVYPHPLLAHKGLQTAGVLSPANYILYEKLPNGAENPLPERSPLIGSGIQYGDRVVWVDGEPIFSSQQLNVVLNDERALVTIQRQGKSFLRRVPRVPVRELKIDAGFRDELSDWQFAAHLQDMRLTDLFMLPYNINPEATVESSLKPIDKDIEQQVWPTHLFSSLEEPLQEGDKILAIDGHPISAAHQVLALLQTHHVHIIVERRASTIAPISSKEGDASFDATFDVAALDKIATTIGHSQVLQAAGPYFLLKPILPKPRYEYLGDELKQEAYQHEVAEQQKVIEAIVDPEKRLQARKSFESRQKELLLGIPNVQDRSVFYNPSPFEMFSIVFSEVARTLTALVTGALNPKWISGPVGIVQIVHQNTMSSLHNALFWLGAISLNLGVINLLPIPVLDGGTITLSLFEMVTGKRLKPKTLERLVIPFAILLISFFVFITFNDLSRIFSNFWH